jgi:antitoxin (DNA-binding transcriptional repressor) of toxin-antitoxin stability system
MKTATVRDLKHDFAKIESWVRMGEQVQVTKRGLPLFEIRPISKTTKKAPVPPYDWAKMRREIWGGRVLTQAEVDENNRLEAGDDC